MEICICEQKGEKMKKAKFKNTPGECLQNFWVDYTGTGRATRAEYWWCVLVYIVIIGTILSFSRILVLVWTLVTMIPFICLTIRRLHDANRSAWNILWFPEGMLVFSTIFIMAAGALSMLGFSTKAIAQVYIGFFMPMFYISLFGSLILMCLPGDKKTNKYGKPRI